MNFDEILKVFLARPKWQRLFFAFTLATFMSCSMRVAQEGPEPTYTTFTTP